MRRLLAQETPGVLPPDGSPFVAILLPLEGRPVCVTNAVDPGEADRMRRWLESRPDLAILYWIGVAASHGARVTDVMQHLLDRGGDLTADDLLRWLDDPHSEDT